jgi:hypothetical protein
LRRFRFVLTIVIFAYAVTSCNLLKDFDHSQDGDSNEQESDTNEKTKDGKNIDKERNNSKNRNDSEINHESGNQGNDIKINSADDPDKDTMESSDEEDQFRDINYQKDGIEGTYPEFISGASEATLDQWNQIISKDFNKILDIYSFNPFPELTPSPATIVPTILKINYELKSNSRKAISILYIAAYTSPYSAYPTNLVYTTNIDKDNSKRLRLSDIVTLNSDFVKNFRTWDLVSPVGVKEDYIQAIRDYIKNLSDEDLLMGFQAADQIGSKNLWGIYTYLTPNRLGISIGVPNYIGDHVEFEKDLSELKDFLKEDYQ